MKVFAFIGARGYEAVTERNHRGQTREIVAAKSKAEVGRIVGKDPRGIFCLGETGNAEDREQALAKPGTVFWKPLDARAETDWREA